MEEFRRISGGIIVASFPEEKL